MSGNRADEATRVSVPEGTQAMPWELTGTDESAVAGFFDDLAEDLVQGNPNEDLLPEEEDEEEPEAGLDDRAESEDDEDDLEDDGPEDESEEDEGEVGEEEDEFEDDSEDTEEVDPEETPEKRGLRLADYTRKTQALAEERKQFEAAAVEFKQEYSRRLEALDKALEEAMGPEPNWDELRQRNPAEFAAQWAEHQRMMESRRKLQQEAQKEAQEADLALFQREAQALMEKLPEWKDEQTRLNEQEAIMDYAVNGLGFTKEEVTGVRDHRVFLMLRAAWKANEAESKRSEVKKKIRNKRKETSRNLKPGARKNQTKRRRSSKELERRRKALEESGDDRSAANLLETMLDQGLF